MVREDASWYGRHCGLRMCFSKQWMVENDHSSYFDFQVWSKDQQKSQTLCKLNIVKVLFLALHAKQKKTKDLGLKEGNSFRIWKGANVPQNYQNRSIWGLNFINVPNSYEKQLVSWLNVRSGYHNNLKFVLLISSHFSKATMVWQNQQKSSILECFQTSLTNTKRRLYYR